MNREKTRKNVIEYFNDQLGGLDDQIDVLQQELDILKQEQKRVRGDVAYNTEKIFSRAKWEASK